MDAERRTGATSVMLQRRKKTTRINKRIMGWKIPSVAHTRNEEQKINIFIISQNYSLAAFTVLLLSYIFLPPSGRIIYKRIFIHT